MQSCLITPASQAFRRLGLALLILGALCHVACTGLGNSTHSADASPFTLSYSANPATYTVGQAITPNVPSFGIVALRSFTVSPALPAGLSLDPSTGVITGRPSLATDPSAFTVTGTTLRGFASARLLLTIHPSVPTLATQPASQAVSLGATATFSVVASGSGPFTYQWQKNGSDISGAKGVSYTTPATERSDDGATFKVVVKDAWNGQVTSQEATLEVLPGSLTQVTNLSDARYGQATLVLGDGRTLILGGRSSSGPLASAEAFDPITQAFTRLSATLQHPRVGLSATLLQDGRVLILGGWNTKGYVASAEIYDPIQGTFAEAGTLQSPRALHTATLLASGKVLVVGGIDGSGQPLGSAELYDPTAQQSTALSPDGATARIFHSASLLGNGSVLVAGGWGGSASLASAALYDPGTGAFTPLTSPLGQSRYLHTATLLNDGSVLLCGGLGATGTLASAERYHPSTGQFAPTGSLTTARQLHAATLLADGSLLISGGWNGSTPLAAFERYEPSTGLFGPATGPSLGYHSHTATPLAGGSVLIVGGYRGGPLGLAVIWKNE